jgi:hypothetical protein
MNLYQPGNGKSKNLTGKKNGIEKFISGAMITPNGGIIE